MNNSVMTEASPDGGRHPMQSVPAVEYVSFRGRRYRRDVVPYTRGAELKRLLFTMKNADEAGTEEAKAEAARIVRRSAPWLLHALLRPTGWRRLVQWITPNPFRSATDLELGLLIGRAMRGMYASRVEFPTKGAPV